MTTAITSGAIATIGENPFLILKPAYRLTLEGRESGKTVRLVVSVLDETKVVGGIEARVVKERSRGGGGQSCGRVRRI